MFVAVDIGNSEVTAGLFHGEAVALRWRLTTRPRTSDEWAAAFAAFLTHAGQSPNEITGVAVASVAPQVTRPVVAGLRTLTGRLPHLLEPRSDVGLVLDVDEPWAVGPDRLANALAALELAAGDAIVVDLGTATNFDCVTADRRFIGGSIMPGLRTSADNLIRAAALLTATDLVPPARAIGRTTAEHIQGGVLFGTADAVDGMVRRLIAEWPTPARPRVIATGGLATLVASLATTIDVVEPDLTLRGIRLAARALGLPV
ncbi:MAG: type III pantothenate kinase [Gemmatimonadales bacterium]|nr:type III pantothenate kinase [Gemmatimonadales bacterium]